MGKKRAVAYIRVSTEKAAQLHSYAFQEHYWQSAFDDDPNTELIGIYADKGISGHSIQKRQQFLAMMDDARAHKFDQIYTKSVSRFARNTTELLEAVRELRDLGIEVIFEKENIHTFEPTSEIFLTVAATIAENDLEVVSQRQRWSIQHRCQNGWISIGSGLYGLKMTEDNELEIVPEEAAVIRYIFESYVHGGLGSRKIADELNAAGIPTRNGYPWDSRHILNLLRNEKFKGDVFMGKNVEHLGERHDNLNGAYGPHYYIENTHEAIVDRETWDAAQRIIQERGAARGKEKPVYAFTGLIECGCCKDKFRHKVNNGQFKWRSDYWGCNTSLQKGKTACDNSRIKDSVLKELFVSAYNEFIERRPQGSSMVALQEVLDDLRQQERDLAGLMLRRLISKDAYETERGSLKARISEVQRKITECRAKRVPENAHVPITAFSDEKAKQFLMKVIVTRFTVTFVFYNGAKITRAYSNGQSGNQVGWYKRRGQA